MLNTMRVGKWTAVVLAVGVLLGWTLPCRGEEKVADKKDLPVVQLSPAAMKLAEAQGEVAKYVAKLGQSNPEFKKIEERLAALSTEMAELSAKRNALLEQDGTYKALLERQAEAMKGFRAGE